MILVFIEINPPLDADIIPHFSVERMQKISYTDNMSDLKQQIIQELATVEDLAAKLRSVAVNAGKQTDLEVAILTEQVRTLREKNANATEMINQSISILKNLK